jgi:hypothetical protein
MFSENLKKIFKKEKYSDPLDRHAEAFIHRMIRCSTYPIEHIERDCGANSAVIGIDFKNGTKKTFYLSLLENKDQAKIEEIG